MSQPLKHTLWGLLLLGGCGLPHEAPDPLASVSPSGACYEANLLDGLDEQSTAELHTVFACLNSTQALNAFAGLDASLDSSSRDGTVGLVVAKLVNQGLTADTSSISIIGVIESVRELIADQDSWRWGLELGLELCFGAPYDELESDVTLNSSTQLAQGVVVPMLDPVGLLAGKLLDTESDALVLLGEVVASTEFPRWLWSMAALGVSTDPLLQDLKETWAEDLGQAIEAAENTSNNRSQRVDGNSLKDLVDALLVQTDNDGRVVLWQLVESLLPILQDASAVSRLKAWVAEEYESGRLRVLASQLLYLASVDAYGSGLESGEPSALLALVRLLALANTEVHCGGTILFWELDINLGNLSVAILETLAQQDPESVSSVVDLLGAVLGVDWLAEDVLGLIPDVCPTIDEQMIEDLQALDRFNDEAAAQALLSLVNLLQKLPDYVPEIVDLLTVAWDFELIPPVEEVLRDLALAPILQDAVDLVPVLLEPENYLPSDYIPSGIEPVELEDAVALVVALVTENQSGQTPLDRLFSPLQVVLNHPATWETLSNLGALLQQGIQVEKLPEALDRLVQTDPELEWRASLQEWLTPENARPFLVLIEAEGPREALATTELAQPGPIPFIGSLVVGGTLDSLLVVIDALLSLFPDE
jgi:hypothetical protein